MERKCQCGKPMTYLKDDDDPMLPEDAEQLEVWECPRGHQHTFPKS